MRIGLSVLVWVLIPLAHAFSLWSLGSKQDLLHLDDNEFGKPYAHIRPKVVIVSMFTWEQIPWFEAIDFHHNVTVPGMFYLFPHVRCNRDYSICQLTTGEGDINAASTLTAFALSPKFDLSKTYFLIAGIGGGEPHLTTLGSVTFAKYAIQVALEHEVAYQDYSEAHPDWPVGYFAYGSKDPWSYPANAYGTEVFELNENLRDRAVQLAQNIPLHNGSEANHEFRQLYEQPVAKSLPQIVKCDVLTSDAYWSGATLGDYFSDYARMMTNGSAEYCAAALEDNASLQVFVRMHLIKLVDFSRVIVMRTILNFVRPPPLYAHDTVKFFTGVSQGGIEGATANLVRAGMPIINDILTNWYSEYELGLKYSPTNYIGDIFGTLGGEADFGRADFIEA
ncbi:uncharacterized protein KQ657_001135 [Scheffersomyces spartinae]|uniref:Purine nucleoside permease n=1 Tax=Scheffersomyces spartinae TaxID=45513 RepID=A0A9P7V875_9ASCO|nr:uncharacterized protein KQ657_001135 [Scheffersomyces spartinae]KAG7193021.1 hypothetical protein KQ657_001135 [Scheffersomyces spartinae]